jgi:hypothetical protein
MFQPEIRLFRTQVIRIFMKGAIVQKTPFAVELEAGKTY